MKAKNFEEDETNFVAEASFYGCLFFLAAAVVFGVAVVVVVIAVAAVVLVAIVLVHVNVVIVVVLLLQ